MKFLSLKPGNGVESFLHAQPFSVASIVKGFTLSELLIVLVILGVIAIFTIPKVLQSEGNSRKRTIFKEDVATLQTVLHSHIQDGTVQLASHICGTNTSIDARLFLEDLNYIKIYTNLSDNIKVQLANGSSVSIFTGGNLIDLYVDWDGPNLGASTWGDDKLYFNFNDTTSTCSGVNKGQYGFVTGQPAGYVTENQSLWDWIWSG